MEFTAFRHEDRESLDELYGRVFGSELAASRAARWEWLYLQNPYAPGGVPRIWVARDGDQVIGQFSTIPVRLSVNGSEIDAAWGTDAMIAPERQRQGIGENLFHMWHANTGASLGFGLTVASHPLLTRLGWPTLGFVSRYAKPLNASTIRAWKAPGSLSIAARRLLMRFRRHARVRTVTQADASFTRLWERIASQFAFAARRDATFLNWKLFAAPHDSYVVGALTRGNEIDGYAAIRHFDDGKRRITLLVDFLVAPDDQHSLSELLAWVDSQAVKNGSAFVRVMATHAAFLRTLRAHGYLERPATHRLTARISALEVPPTFYDTTERWHVTLADADADQ